MPTYEYECLACKHRFERVQKFSAPAITECPECGSAVRKVLFPAGIVFKGSGWYITDSRPSTSSDNGSSGAGGAKTDAKTDTKTDTKTETKTEAKAETKPAAKSDSSSGSTSDSSKAAGSSTTSPAKA